MMWQLPKLEWNGSVWRLPLTARASYHLVLALLDEPAACCRRLERILQQEPALLLWIVCQHAAWRASPPANSAAPANWLFSTAIPSGIFHVAADNYQTSAADDALEMRSECCRELPSAADDAFELLSRCGARASPDSLRDCPWFPLWRFPPEGHANVDQPPETEAAIDQPSGAAHAAAVQRAIAGLLPQVLAKARRLRELETQFSVALEREKLASLRELAYGASHEVNNPLANIATRAQALLRDEPNPERKRTLSTIAAQAFRAHEMIADMMLFAKPPAPVMKRVDAITIVRSAIREVAPDAASQQTELVFDPPPEPLVVSADVTQLGVVVAALLRNALEALGAGGTIAVAVREGIVATTAGPQLEIAVRDSGPGITPEVRRHLFDPFYSGREAGRGLGFGLSKCWRIAELHGGTIEVDSEPGFGATFTFRIPSRGV